MSVPRLTVKENVVLRLIGLFIFIAPTHGADFLADCVVRVNDRIAKGKREQGDKAMAA